MKIEVPDPNTIDGTPSQVANAALLDAQEVVNGLRRYLEDVEVQVRNAVMQDAIQANLPRTFEYWEQSPELRILSALATKASTLATGLTLLRKVRAGQVQSNLPPESGSGSRNANGQEPESVV